MHDGHASRSEEDQLEAIETAFRRVLKQRLLAPTPDASAITAVIDVAIALAQVCC